MRARASPSVAVQPASVAEAQPPGTDVVGSGLWQDVSRCGTVAFAWNAVFFFSASVFE
jgi:hypothetical protein